MMTMWPTVGILSYGPSLVLVSLTCLAASTELEAKSPTGPGNACHSREGGGRVCGMTQLPPVFVSLPVQTVGDSTGSHPTTLSLQQKATIGWQLIHAGSFEEAHRIFAELVKENQTHVPVLLGLGMALGKLGRDEEARETFQRVLQLDERQSLAHEALGDILAKREALPEAIAHYKRGLELDHQNGDLQKRFRRAQQEWEQDRAWERLTSDHFLIKYRAVFTSSQHLEILVRELEQVYVQLGRLFQYYPQQRVTVRVYPGDEFWGITKSPTWAQGLYDGTIHFPLKLLEADPLILRGLLRHEYTHAVVDRQSMGRTPVWLTEGLASHFEKAIDQNRWFENYHAREGADHIFPRYDQFFVELSPQAAQAAYGAGLQATEYLLETYGVEGVTQLLRGLCKQAKFSRVFEATFQVPYTTFKDQWLQQEQVP